HPSVAMCWGEDIRAHTVPVTRTLPCATGAEARAAAYPRIETRVIGGPPPVEDRCLRTNEHDAVDGREAGKMRQAAVRCDQNVALVEDLDDFPDRRRKSCQVEEPRRPNRLRHPLVPHAIAS